MAARATTIASHCTVSVTGTEFTVVLSVAVITILEWGMFLAGCRVERFRGLPEHGGIGY